MGDAHGSISTWLDLVLLQAKFGYRLDDAKWAPDWLPNEQLEMLHSDIEARQVIDGEFEQILKDLGVSLVCHAVCYCCTILVMVNQDETTRCMNLLCTAY